MLDNCYCKKVVYYGVKDRDEPILKEDLSKEQLNEVFSTREWFIEDNILFVRKKENK